IALQAAVPAMPIRPLGLAHRTAGRGPVRSFDRFAEPVQSERRRQYLQESAALIFGQQRQLPQPLRESPAFHFHPPPSTSINDTWTRTELGSSISTLNADSANSFPLGLRSVSRAGRFLPLCSAFSTVCRTAMASVRPHPYSASMGGFARLDVEKKF
ncbi:hypothetical protein, partial [Massilia sp. AB1]|uniref:hypothetical protein n=1 Tax=Massilia sp. AB1 TaxID=2823371 RepID=UPI001B81C125